jgi:hypothetical protein
VKLEATPNGMSGPVSLSRIDTSEPRTQYGAVQLPTTLELKLQPWQMCCILQTSLAL